MRKHMVRIDAVVTAYGVNIVSAAGHKVTYGKHVPATLFSANEEFGERRVGIGTNRTEFAGAEDAFFPVGEAESRTIKRAVAYWDDLRAGRRFPARSQVTLRGLGRLAKNAALVRVIDGGADYEFRFVGHEPTAAIGINLQGRRMSEPQVESVMSANFRRRLYDHVVRTAMPWLFKSRMVNHIGLRLPVCSETAFLPLGAEEHTVDHLLGFTVFCSKADL